MKNYDFEGEPFVVIERDESSVGSFLFGALVGAGIALLIAPRSGAQTRRMIGTRARATGDRVRDRANDVADAVAARAADTREQINDRVGAARDAVRRSRTQVLDAIDAGRHAAIEARSELEKRIAENKAAHRESNGL